MTEYQDAGAVIMLEVQGSKNDPDVEAEITPSVLESYYAGSLCEERHESFTIDVADSPKLPPE